MITFMLQNSSAQVLICIVVLRVSVVVVSYLAEGLTALVSFYAFCSCTFLLLVLQVLATKWAF